MTVINKNPKAMAITGRGQLTYLVSQNKYICLWHRHLAHVSNTRVVKAFNLVNGTNLDIKKEYNLVEIFVNSDNSNVSNA